MQKLSRAIPVLTKARSRVMAALAIPVLLALLAPAVQAAPAALLVVTAPLTATAGTAFNFTVRAIDVSNNTATGYTGTVHFTSTDGAATLPADYTFTTGDNGVHTFSATLKTVGSQTITATDTGNGTITGSATVTVNAASPTIAKAFNPATIQSGGTSVVTLTLSNSNTSALSNGSFTDTLVNMSAVGGAVGGTCVGTTPATLSAGATALSFTGITIPASSSCTVIFSVTSSTAGGNNNTTSGVTTTQTPTAGTVSNTATVTVGSVSSIPTLSDWGLIAFASLLVAFVWKRLKSIGNNPATPA